MQWATGCQSTEGHLYRAHIKDNLHSVELNVFDLEIHMVFDTIKEKAAHFCGETTYYRPTILPTARTNEQTNHPDFLDLMGKWFNLSRCLL